MTADGHEGDVLDVIVVGAGQAGLATGYFLRQKGLHFRLFDRAARVGDSWRRRYDSLTLFSPRAYCALPGSSMDGDREGYPGKEEIADYLEQYARTWKLPVSMEEGITRLEHRNERFHAVTSRGRRVVGRAVIIASGAFQRSVVPSFASDLSREVMQLTAERYRNPAQIPAGRVLVVGGGATGRQIARELARSHDVSLSIGHRVSITPQRVFGRDVIEWFDRLGFLRADRSTARGRFAMAHESFPGLHLRTQALRRQGIHMRARNVGVTSAGWLFADGSSGTFESVIWAIGYRDDGSWLRIPAATDDSGNYLHDRGVSPVKGLFHVGRSWQTCRASALLCGVAGDAARIVERVAMTLRDAVPEAASRLMPT